MGGWGKGDGGALGAEGGGECRRALVEAVRSSSTVDQRRALTLIRGRHAPLRRQPPLVPKDVLLGDYISLNLVRTHSVNPTLDVPPVRLLVPVFVSWAGRWTSRAPLEARGSYSLPQSAA